MKGKRNCIIINLSEKYLSSVKKQMVSAKSSPLKDVREMKSRRIYLSKKRTIKSCNKKKIFKTPENKIF